MLFSPSLYLPMGKQSAAAGGGGAATTWSANATGIVLTGSNLVATVTIPPFNDQCVESVASISSSVKKYMEFVATFIPGGGTGDFQLGFADGTYSVPTSGSLINVANAFGYRGDGLMGYNGANSIAAGFAQGDVVSLAIDGPNAKVWVRVNGGSWDNTTDDPASNTGGASISGISFPVFAIFREFNNTAACTARFSSASWSFAAPSGFGQL